MRRNDPPRDIEEVDHVVILLGLPNAGKSTLVNHLTNGITTIAHRKARTTRAPIVGLIEQDGHRIALIDTPGLLKPERDLEHAMMRTTKHRVRSADLLLLVIDAASKQAVDASLPHLEKWMSFETPCLLVLNKVDRADKPSLLSTASLFQHQHPFNATYMISAHTGNGTQALLNGIMTHLPAPLCRTLPMVSMPFFAAELTRSVLLDHVHDELPHDLAVIPIDWRSLRDKSIRIEQSILVRRASQRAIMLGRRGSMIKRIREKTAKKIRSRIGYPVHLFLHIKLHPHWDSDPFIRRKLGLPKE